MAVTVSSKSRQQRDMNEIAQALTQQQVDWIPGPLD